MKTEPKREEQSRIDELFKTLQTLFLLLLTVTFVIGSLILRPDHTRQIDDALNVLNTLRMADSMFREEHLPRVQAEGQRLFRELVFLKLAESIERTFGLSLDVAAAELNFKPARRFEFSNVKEEIPSLGSIVRYADNQEIYFGFNVPHFQNMLDDFPPELRSVSNKLILSRLNLEFSTLEPGCHYSVVFKAGSSGREITMKGITKTEAYTKSGGRPIFKFFALDASRKPISMEPLRTLWIWPDIERVTIEQAIIQLSNLKTSEKTRVSFLGIEAETNSVVLIGPILIFAILLHAYFHVAHISGKRALYGDRLSINFPWIGILPDRYFRRLATTVFCIPPITICIGLLIKYGKNVSFIVWICTLVTLMAIGFVSFFLFRELKRLRKQIWESSEKRPAP
jgi:hypothetical protein